MANSQSKSQKPAEIKAFLFITVLLFPILSIMFVGGYGFVVWIMQLLFLGPPGGHG